MLATLLMALFSHPELLTEAESVFKSIATGEGGAQKVAAVASNLSAVALTAASVAGAVAKPAA